MQADLTAQTNIALHDEVPFETRQQVIEHVAATEQSRISEVRLGKWLQPPSRLSRAISRDLRNCSGRKSTASTVRMFCSNSCSIRDKKDSPHEEPQES